MKSPKYLLFFCIVLTLVLHAQADPTTKPTTQSATPKTPSVLLVTDGNVFLEQGLHSQKLKAYDKISPQDYHKLESVRDGGKKLSKPYDVIIFDRDDDLKPEEVPRSGGAIYFGCVPPGLELKAAVDAASKRVIVEDNNVADWDRDHPIVQHLNFGKVVVKQSFKLQPTDKSKVLVNGTGGPLIVLHREGGAIHLVIPFDLMQSNLPIQPVFPVFLYQALQYMAVEAGTK